MSKTSEAAERLLRNLDVSFEYPPGEPYDNDEDIRAVVAAYMRIILKLRSHCNSATNLRDHGVAYEILREMGER